MINLLCFPCARLNTLNEGRKKVIECMCNFLTLKRSLVEFKGRFIVFLAHKEKMSWDGLLLGEWKGKVYVFC